MPSQQKLDQTYMDMAECWSTLSKAVRKKVGCLIVKDGTIISDGYNGTPSGFDNTCELQGPSETLITKPEVLHAESNAISKLAKSTEVKILNSQKTYKIIKRNIYTLFFFIIYHVRIWLF